MMFEHRLSKKAFAEDTQIMQIEFCLARKRTNGNWTNQTYWSQCRDFMGDAVYANATKKSVSIYGFNYNPTYKLPVTYSAFGLRFNDTKTYNNFKDNFPYIHIFDQLANAKPAEMILFDDFCLTIVVKADKIWNETLLNVSLYTFLLKCIVYQTDNTTTFWDNVRLSTGKRIDWDGTTEDYPTNEATYIKYVSTNLIKKLVLHIKQITKQVPCVHGVANYGNFDSNVHHNSGWYSTLKWKNNLFWKELQKYGN